MITYNVDGVKMPKIKKRETNAWIKAVAADHGKKVGDIGYMFVDDERIVIATNKFKPDNILVGQGFIAAQSRNQAIEWLKIIKTALIFVDDNKEELNEELSSKRRNKNPEVRDDYDMPNTFENFWE